MYRIITRVTDPLLQLHHAPELLTTADGAVHEKRAASCITLHAVWNVSTGKQAYHLVVHRLSPGIGSHLLATIHAKGFSIGDCLRWLRGEHGPVRERPHITGDRCAAFSCRTNPTLLKARRQGKTSHDLRALLLAWHPGTR